MRGTGVNLDSEKARCVCGLAKTPAIPCRHRQRSDLITYPLSPSLASLGHLAIPNNNSQSQALEAEARRGLESEMMCMSQGPQTFQSQVLLEVIFDLDPREGGSENGQPKPFQPAELAWMDGVRDVSCQSRCAGDRLFPIILEALAGVPRLRMCPHLSLSRQVTDRCVGWSPTG